MIQSSLIDSTDVSIWEGALWGSLGVWLQVTYRPDRANHISLTSSPPLQFYSLYTKNSICLLANTQISHLRWERVLDFLLVRRKDKLFSLLDIRSPSLVCSSPAIPVPFPMCATVILSSPFFSYAFLFHSSSPLPRMHPLPFAPSLVLTFFGLIL